MEHFLRDALAALDEKDAEIARLTIDRDEQKQFAEIYGDAVAEWRPIVERADAAEATVATQAKEIERMKAVVDELEGWNDAALDREREWQAGRDSLAERVKELEARVAKRNAAEHELGGLNQPRPFTVDNVVFRGPWVVSGADIRRIANIQDSLLLFHIGRGGAVDMLVRDDMRYALRHFHPSLQDPDDYSDATAFYTVPK